MRVVDLCEFFSERGGGVRSYLTEQARAASRLGHEFAVVAPGPRDEEQPFEGGRLLRYKAPKMPYDATYHVPWRVDRMRQLVRDLRPDVLQVSSPFLPALAAGNLREVPLRAYVYHSDPIGCYVTRAAACLPWAKLRETAERPSWAFMRAVCNSADLTIVSGTWLSDLLASHGIHNARTVPFGIRHAQFGRQHASPELRRSMLGAVADDPRARLMLVAGRLAADKRQSLVFDGLSRLARERPIGVVMLGDGPERERLRARAGEFAAFEWLPFTHSRAEYARLLASVDALVHGSMCETFGFVIAETLASGTPVVVPDVGGAPALVDAHSAELYPAFDGPEAVAAAVRRLLERPVVAMREGALAAAGRLVETDHHYEELFRVYEHELAARGRRSAQV